LGGKYTKKETFSKQFQDKTGIEVTGGSGVGLKQKNLFTVPTNPPHPKTKPS